MIYIVRAGDTPYVKIGYAVDVARRVALIQCGNHETLHLLRTAEGEGRLMWEEYASHALCFILGAAITAWFCLSGVL